MKFDSIEGLLRWVEAGLGTLRLVSVRGSKLRRICLLLCPRVRSQRDGQGVCAVCAGARRTASPAGDGAGGRGAVGDDEKATLPSLDLTCGGGGSRVKEC